MRSPFLTSQIWIFALCLFMMQLWIRSVLTKLSICSGFWWKLVMFSTFLMITSSVLQNMFLMLKIGHSYSIYKFTADLKSRWPFSPSLQGYYCTYEWQFEILIMHPSCQTSYWASPFKQNNIKTPLKDEQMYLIPS